MSSSFRDHQAHYRAHHRTVGCKITHLFGVPMIFLSLPAFFLNRKVCAGLFVTGWALQFIGHFVFEKNRPMLFKDPKDPLTYFSALIFVTEEWVNLLTRGGLDDSSAARDKVHPFDRRSRRTRRV